MRKEQRAAAAAGGFRFNGAKRRRNDYEWNYSSGNGVAAAAAGGLQVLQKNGGSCVVVGSEVNVPYSRDIPLPWIRIVIPTRPAEEDDRKKKKKERFLFISFPFMESLRRLFTSLLVNNLHSHLLCQRRLCFMTCRKKNRRRVPGKVGIN